MPNSPVIEVRGLTFTYPGSEEPILKDVHLTVERGDFLALIGSNGCGKSTLCKTFNGLIPNYYVGEFAGEVMTNGHSTTAVPVTELSKHVGYVYQDFENQLVRPTVRDDVCFAPLNYGMADYKERGEEALRLTGLLPLADEFVWQLSGGQKHLLALAGCLAMEPELLVIDEPVAQLDPQHAREIYELLRVLNEQHGKTIIVIEHHTEFIAEYCKHAALMDGGRLLWKKPVREALTLVDELLARSIHPPQVTQAARVVAWRAGEAGVAGSGEAAVARGGEIGGSAIREGVGAAGVAAPAASRGAVGNGASVASEVALAGVSAAVPAASGGAAGVAAPTASRGAAGNGAGVASEVALAGVSAAVPAASGSAAGGPWPIRMDEAAAYFAGLVRSPEQAAAAAPGGASEERPPSAPAEALVEFRQATLTYPMMNREVKTVLDGLDVTFHRGERIALVGNNGAGKSSLLRLIAGITRPKSGQVIVSGLDTAKVWPERLSDFVALVFQNPEEMFIEDSIRKDIEYFGKARGLDGYEARTDELLARFELTGLQHRDGRMLSGGQQRKAAMAIAAAMKPSIMLLDEPTANLDMATRSELFRLLDQLNDLVGTVVIATHDMQLVAEWANRILVLNHGSILLDGSREQLFQNEPIMRRAGLTPPQITELSRMLGWSPLCYSVDEFAERAGKEGVYGSCTQAAGQSIG
ncbi:ABC transporter ATP-binding protein [Paenibacillus turpanensis]|uniref:ABC transporter ATP-binding protein n=1 Tax=Paenibacillus turpanensis TaxID=2689078 RepID=UPI001408D96D|nr:ABC transporter ATP-binding protein [Paenibacillus turpanensis]